MMSDSDQKLDRALERTGKISCLVAAWLVIAVTVVLIVGVVVFGSDG